MCTRTLRSKSCLAELRRAEQSILTTSERRRLTDLWWRVFGKATRRFAARRHVRAVRMLRADAAVQFTKGTGNWT